MSGTKRNRRSKRDAARTAVGSEVAPDPTVVSLVEPEVWEPGRPPLAARPSGHTAESDGATAALERLAADVRALVALARSSALPPERRVAEVERTAIQHLADLRARLAAAGDDPPEARPAQVAALPPAMIALDYTDVA
jgi:hypothetical protein